MSEIAAVGCGPMIVVITDSPDAQRRRPETEELLGDPKHVPSDERETEVAVTDGRNANLWEQRNGGGIERVGWGNPDVGLDPMALKNLDSAAEFLFLLGNWDTGEFGSFYRCNDARTVRYIPVLVSVQGDGPTARLPGSDPLPKVLDWRVHLQNRILVIGNDGQDRFQILIE